MEKLLGHDGAGSYRQEASPKLEDVMIVRIVRMAVLALSAALVLSGCLSNSPAADGRYATFDGGRSNNRAALPGAPMQPSM